MKIAVIFSVLFFLTFVNSAPNTVTEKPKLLARYGETLFSRKAQNAGRKEFFSESRKKRCESCRESKLCKVHGKCEFCSIICKDLDIAITTTEIPISGGIQKVATEVNVVEKSTNSDDHSKIIGASHQQDAEITSDNNILNEDIRNTSSDVKALNNNEESNKHLHSRSVSDGDSRTGIQNQDPSTASDEDVSNGQFQLFLKKLEEKVENLAELIRKTCGPSENVVEKNSLPITKKSNSDALESSNSNHEIQKVIENNKVANIQGKEGEKQTDPIANSSNNFDDIVGNSKQENKKDDITKDVQPQSRFKEDDNLRKGDFVINDFEPHSEFNKDNKEFKEVPSEVMEPKQKESDANRNFKDNVNIEGQSLQVGEEVENVNEKSRNADVSVGKPNLPIIAKGLENEFVPDVTKMKDVLPEIDKFHHNLNQPSREVEHPSVTTIKEVDIEKSNKPTPSNRESDNTEELTPNVNLPKLPNSRLNQDVSNVKEMSLIPSNAHEFKEALQPTLSKVKEADDEFSEFQLVSSEQLESNPNEDEINIPKFGEASIETSNSQVSSGERMEPTRNSKPEIKKLDQLDLDRSPIKKIPLQIGDIARTVDDDLKGLAITVPKKVITPSSGSERFVESANIESSLPAKGQTNPVQVIETVQPNELESLNPILSDSFKIAKDAEGVDQFPSVDQRFSEDSTEIVSKPLNHVPTPSQSHQVITALVPKKGKTPSFESDRLVENENVESGVPIAQGQASPVETFETVQPNDLKNVKAIPSDSPKTTKDPEIVDKLPSVDHRFSKIPTEIASHPINYLNTAVIAPSKPYGVVAKLVPENNSDKVMFVSDGMNLPFNLKKHADGSYHLAMDLQKLCQSCNDDIFGQSSKVHSLPFKKTENSALDENSHVISKREVQANHSLFYPTHMHKKRKPLPTNYKKKNLTNKQIKMENEKTQSKTNEININVEKLKLVNNVFGWLKKFIDPKQI